MMILFRHLSIVIARARHDESTSNLIRHVDRCQPADSAEARAIAGFAHGSMYNPATHRMKIALWVVCHHRLFAIVEDEYLLEIFHDLNNKCITPSAGTVSRDVKEIFMLTQKRWQKCFRHVAIFFFAFSSSIVDCGI